jgi:lipopolysaccharide export system protein LptA
MKVILTLLAVVVCGMFVVAQTNTPTATVTNIPASAVITNSDIHVRARGRLEYVFETKEIIHREKVHVEYQDMQLWCELLTAIDPGDAKRIEKITAETNVIIRVAQDGGTNNGTGDKLVYTYNVVDGVTNELAELTGTPARVETSKGVKVNGQMIIYDFTQRKLIVPNSDSQFPMGTNNLNF